MRASARLALVVFGVFAIVLVVLFMTPSSYYTARQNNATGVVTPYPTAVATSIPKTLAYNHALCSPTNKAPYPYLDTFYIRGI